ncbi:dienelactone hydrolase family protein [Cryobacterium sp. Y62]|uniref:dienelactone hydrolase family protein n=1 Tax=Cryobacterium sp. Y62 TaxID=2048284 RepID=UPI000CE30ECD
MHLPGDTSECWPGGHGHHPALVSPSGRDVITAAPHLYHRIEDPVVTDGKFNQARRYHDTLTTEGLTCDIESAQAWIRAQGAQKVAIMGFSMGGTLAVWAAAAALRIDAAVTFYGVSLASPRWPGILRRSVKAVQKNCYRTPHDLAPDNRRIHKPAR